MSSDVTPDPDDPLNRVVVDEPPDEEAVAWAANQLLTGRAFSDVAADLTEQGWTNAEATVELARVQTRAARGVVTRDDIVGELARRHRPAVNGLPSFSPLSFIGALRAALHAAVRLKQIAGGRRNERSP